MYLRNEANSQLHSIQCFHIFGRNPLKSDTVLDHPSTSQIHASIRWNNGHWEIVDHSQNGTFINHQRIKQNEEMALLQGQKILFGSLTSALWVVVNIDPPMHHFFENTKSSCDPKIANITSNCAQQKLNLNETSQNSIQNKIAPIAATTSFNFQVSQNEEHVNLHVKIGDQLIDLGERTHHYSLLTLARHRASDAYRGIDSCSQGWICVKQLAKMLGVTPPHLNMQIHRAKEQFEHKLGESYQEFQFIERRRGEMRLAELPFEIKQGSKIDRFKHS
jgi:hypothetical protein